MTRSPFRANTGHGLFVELARQTRWRPVWFATVDRDGIRHELVVRGDRTDMPLISSGPANTGVSSQPCSPCQTLRCSKGRGTESVRALRAVSTEPVDAVATTRADATMMVPLVCT